MGSKATPSVVYSPESQPTQILQNILEGNEPDASWNKKPALNNRSPLERDTTGDAPSELASSSSYHSGPRYHYHGLANTQTQDDSNNQAEIAHKENALSNELLVAPRSHIPRVAEPPIPAHIKGAQPLTRQTPRFGIASTVDSSKNNVPSSPPKRVTRASSKGPAPLRSTAPKSSRDVATRGKPSSTRRLRRQRSSSQDSFAGPLYVEDPQKAFLESNKIFDMPLSELGRDVSPGGSSYETPKKPSSSRPVRHASPPRGWPSSPASPAILPESSPLAPSVLVEATPSHTDGSQPSQQGQGQGQAALDFSQDSHIGAQGQGQGIDYSSPRSSPAPTQLVPDYSTGDDSQSQPKSYEATQPAEDPMDYEPTPTQPVDEGTQDEFGIDPYTGSGVPFQAGPSNQSSVPSTVVGPRNLLAQLDPEKLRRRYPNVQVRSASPEQPDLQNASDGQTQPSVEASAVNAEKEAEAEELFQYILSRKEENEKIEASDGQTQPSVEASGPAAEKEAQGEELFQYIMSRKAENEREKSREPTPTPSRQFAQDDVDMDVVPDSEPPRPAALSPSTPIIKRMKPAMMSSSSKRTPRGKGRIHDVVPDSVGRRMEEEEDEEDIPLAAASRAGKRKAVDDGESSAANDIPFPTKAQTRSKDKAPSRRSRATATPHPASPSLGAQARASHIVKPKAGAQSSTPNEVPSSVPQQDFHRPSTSSNSVVPPTTPRSSVRDSSDKQRSANSTPRQKILPGPSFDSPLSDTDEDDGQQDDPLDLITAVKEEEEEGETEEQRTEPADDLPMAEDQELDDPAPNKKPSRKRKRVASVAQKRLGGKPSTRSSKTPSATPVPRPNKRLKGQTSTLRGVRVDATRVFALWRQDNCYYAGTVYSRSDKGPTRFNVHFDDDTSEDVDVAKLRRCEPRVGDAVIVNESDMPGKISRVLDGEGKTLYEVEVDHGAELDRATLEVKEFRVAARSLTSQWKNRTIKIDDIVPMIQPKVLKQSLSPSKNSLFSSASARTARPKPLSKIGLVVTLSTNVDDPDATRNGLQQSIKNNGGILLDDWSCILPIGSKRTAKRWVIMQNDLQYTPMEGIDKVFLLSDDANQKAKYLVALALGIPCLEMSWLNSVNEEEGLDAWQTYLLPAGLSEHLNARVSQIVDLDWGTCKEHLSEVLTNPVATKLLTGKSVLLLGTEYFPASTGRRRGSSGPDNGNMESVPRIILAMGAARVEVVADAKSALDTKLTSYDYVIVKDESSPVYTNAKADVTCVPMQWVKDCLISGRLLPLMQR